MPRYNAKANKPGQYPAYPQRRPSPKKIWSYTAAAGCLILILLAFTSSPVPNANGAAQHLHPFGPTAHQPPPERNSTRSGEARWYNHWKWLNPFSDSITDDDSRSVLPPPRERPPIYAFYDTDGEKDEKVKAAENTLLLIWRRAWWAQGFRPVILGKAEAMNNPLYERFQVRKTERALGTELIRWLAWGQMGTGILSNWLVLPMGPYDDHLLSFLRRGEYPKLTRYEGLGGGFFSGDKASIEAALAQALDSTDLKDSKSLLELVPSKTFAVDPKPSSIAFYDSSTLADQYKPISASLTDSKADGLLDLSELITSHLHLTFLNTFPSGISILTPHRSRSLIIQYPAITLAKALITCPSSPIPASCPPNNPKCIPCSSMRPLPLKTPEVYTNASTLFTIGTLPHPYSLASLLAKTKTLSIPHVRRNTARDPWLTSVTLETLGPLLSGYDRIVSFKEIVASKTSFSRGLWLVAEESPVEESSALNRRELEWHFGFAIPAYNTSTTALPLSNPELKTSAITAALADPQLYPASSDDGEKVESLGEKEVRHQRELLAHSVSVLDLDRTGKMGKWKGRRRSDNKGGEVVSEERVRDATEAWHLADTEAWRFVRAWGARGRLERKRWEDEERRFAGGGGEGWGRWFDR
ncbi:MAG: hypothetical protein LQ338_004826 [Usnochroma carphineum]|nr:MAG: hypothetical protein LQ338_004826 [Usnochroma carphineum]